MNNRNEEKLWKGLQTVFENKDQLPTPIKDFHLFGVSILVWKHIRFNLEFLETEPYKIDGEVPMMFLDIGPIEFIFENKCIYKYLYRRKNGYNPRGL